MKKLNFALLAVLSLVSVSSEVRGSTHNGPSNYGQTNPRVLIKVTIERASQYDSLKDISKEVSNTFASMSTMSTFDARTFEGIAHQLQQICDIYDQNKKKIEDIIFYQKRISENVQELQVTIETFKQLQNSGEMERLTEEQMQSYLQSTKKEIDDRFTQEISKLDRDTGIVIKRIAELSQQISENLNSFNREFENYQERCKQEEACRQRQHQENALMHEEELRQQRVNEELAKIKAEQEEKCRFNAERCRIEAEAKVQLLKEQEGIRKEQLKAIERNKIKAAFKAHFGKLGREAIGERQQQQKEKESVGSHLDEVPIVQNGDYAPALSSGSNQKDNSAFLTKEELARRKAEAGGKEIISSKDDSVTLPEAERLARQQKAKEERKEKQDIINGASATRAAVEYGEDQWGEFKDNINSWKGGRNDSLIASYLAAIELVFGKGYTQIKLKTLKGQFQSILNAPSEEKLNNFKKNNKLN